MPGIDFGLFPYQPADWMSKAACRGVATSTFFPEQGESAVEAKRRCLGSPDDGIPPCPVRLLCLDFAMNHPVRLVGVWGGTTERERHAINRTNIAQARKTQRKKETPVSKHIPPHGSVRRYDLEMSVTGQPCEACTLAKWRQQNAQQDNPELAEVVRLVHETNTGEGN